MRTTALHSAGDLLSDWLLPLSVVLRTFVWFCFALFCFVLPCFVLFALFSFAHLLLAHSCAIFLFFLVGQLTNLLLDEAVVLVAQVAHWD